MSLQFTCFNVCILALVAFECLFSRVTFQMALKVMWVRRGIMALIAFERSFSRVPFQMQFQIAFNGRCIVAVVAFEWFFSGTGVRDCIHSAGKFMTDIPFFLLTMTINYFGQTFTFRNKLILILMSDVVRTKKNKFSPTFWWLITTCK